MASINPALQSAPAADWFQAGLRYHALNYFFRQKFGQRVWKISLDAGFDCPNADGTLGRGGCVFCDPASFSPSRRLQIAGIDAQLEQGIARLRQRYGVGRFVAYFQPGTNTYGTPQRLRELFAPALAHPEVVGLIVGTRPDCVPDAVLDLLAELQRQTWVSVEYGLQSIHNGSLDWMNRGHHYEAFLDAYARSRQRGLHVGAHVILGLPGETPAQMLATADELARLDVDAAKIHNLYAVRRTALAVMVKRGEVTLPELDAYKTWVVDFLERLPPRCVIDRLSGDAPPEFLIGPAWCADKAAVKRAIEHEFLARDTWQGKAYGSGERGARGSTNR